MDVRGLYNLHLGWEAFLAYIFELLNMTNKCFVMPVAFIYRMTFVFSFTEKSI